MTIGYKSSSRDILYPELIPILMSDMISSLNEIYSEFLTIGAFRDYIMIRTKEYISFNTFIEIEKSRYSSYNIYLMNNDFLTTRSFNIKKTKLGTVNFWEFDKKEKIKECIENYILKKFI